MMITHASVLKSTETHNNLLKGILANESTSGINYCRRI